MLYTILQVFDHQLIVYPQYLLLIFRIQLIKVLDKLVYMTRLCMRLSQSHTYSLPVKYCLWIQYTTF